MAISVLELDDFESDNFNLIAIKTSVQSYRLAYLINQVLEISLEKSEFSLDLTKFGIKTSFEVFVYEDKTNQLYWSLISNYSYQTILGYTKELELIEDNEVSDIHLIPEYNDVQFFLKIEETQNTKTIQELFRKLEKISILSNIYEIDKNTLVSINNLLF